MVIIQNNSQIFQNYDDIITKCMQDATNFDFMVSYVRLDGFDENLFNNKNIRLICSLDMGITDIDSLINLIDEYKADIKICRLSQGTFHSKMFIFDDKKMIVGSANITRSAMKNNIETGIYLTENDYIEKGKKIFDQLWKESDRMTIEDLKIFKNSYENKKKINRNISTINIKGEQKNREVSKNILSFIQDWSGIKRSLRGKGELTNIWRGWYVIPDQGHVSDNLMQELKQICEFIAKKGYKINITKGSSDEESLEDFLKDIKVLKRSSHKMTYRDRFIRGDKNYMVKLGFAKEINKELILTELGKKLVITSDINKIKKEYTSVIEDIQFYGLNMLRFLKECLIDLDKYITLEEYNWFMQHAQSYSDKEIIVNIIKCYRFLDDNNKESLRKKVKEKLNSNLEDGKTKNVVGNYNKSAETNISAFGWCDGFNYDRSKLIYK